MTSLPRARALAAPSLVTAVLLALVAPLRADPACALIFGDHMVLQCGGPVPVWGTASPGEQVTVAFGGQSAATRADAAGAWSVRLGAMPASAAPRDLTVTGHATLRFTDVLVGEVWLCSGQSNMEKPVGVRPGQKPTNDYVNAIREASHPLIRLYQVPRFGRPDPTEVAYAWVPCDPSSIVHTKFSAVGYYFGREIQRELGVPVGMIDSTYGGTEIEEWTPPEAFSRYPDLAAFSGASPMPALADGHPVSGLYVSMVSPIVPFALRGFLWYQGESNLMKAETGLYTDKMRAMVGGWRSAWGNPDLPFYYVEIAPFRYSGLKNKPQHVTVEALPLFWEAQTRALSIPHTAMVVTTDLVGDVDDIHPTEKLEVGRRLAGLALGETYGRPGAFARSPMFASMRVLPTGQAELSFTDTDGELDSSNGKPLSDFTIAGADMHFVPAEVAIKGDTLLAQSPLVKDPVAVRFAWAEDATPNLVNASGLPAMPFRTDSWPVAVERHQ